MFQFANSPFHNTLSFLVGSKMYNTLNEPVNTYLKGSQVLFWVFVVYHYGVCRTNITYKQKQNICKLTHCKWTEILVVGWCMVWGATSCRDSRCPLSSVIQPGCDASHIAASGHYPVKFGSRVQQSVCWCCGVFFCLRIHLHLVTVQLSGHVSHLWHQIQRVVQLCRWIGLCSLVVGGHQEETEWTVWQCGVWWGHLLFDVIFYSWMTEIFLVCLCCIAAFSLWQSSIEFSKPLSLLSLGCFCLLVK